MPAPDDGFDQIINEEWHVNPNPAYTGQGPYGTPAQPVKPGLTNRGKVAIAVASVAVAGTGFFWYQDHSVQVAKEAKEAAALEIQVKQLELEKLKDINKVTAAQKKDQATEDAARQKFVDACVDADKGLVGKQMGVTYRSVMADCQAQYKGGGGGADGSDMATAASADDTSSGGINNFVLLGGGTLAIGLVWMVKKGSRRAPEYPAPYRPY